MNDELVERVEAVIARQMMRTVLHDPGGRMYTHVARAVIAEVLEEAVKVCDVIENRLTEQWKANHKICDYTQGASDGANDCAAAIRAMIQQERME